VPPALGVLVLAVLTMAKSATKLTVTGTELVLLPGVGSVVPTGAVTLAVLVRVPAAPGATLTWKVTVADWPLARVLVPLMVLPAAAAVMPALGTMLVMVPRPAGRVSVQVALVTALGPLLAITMV
jgi:hypothetical protein